MILFIKSNGVVDGIHSDSQEESIAENIRLGYTMEWYPDDVQFIAHPTEEGRERVAPIGQQPWTRAELNQQRARRVQRPSMDLLIEHEVRVMNGLPGILEEEDKALVVQHIQDQQDEIDSPKHDQDYNPAKPPIRFRPGKKRLGRKA